MAATPKTDKHESLSEPNAAPENPAGERLEKYKEKLLELLAIGLPTLLLQGIFKALADRFFDQPWHAVWLAAPLGAVAWIAWRIAKGRKDLALRGSALIFFVAYVAGFALAASTSLLDWNRKLTVFGQPVPRSWLAPNWIGDWRYWLFPRRLLVPDDLILVTRQRPQGDAADVRGARLLLSNLIQLAVNQRAKGVALDFLFLQKSSMDPVLCSRLTAAESIGVPVFLVFPFERAKADLVRAPGAEAFDNCVPEDRWGHSAGFVDLDYRARFIPLYFRHQKELPALSLRIAEALAGREPKVPNDGLLQLMPPRGELPHVSVETLRSDSRSRARLRNRFVLIGEDSERDRWVTPFGTKSGLWIHAAAVHALRHDHFVERAPWWASLGQVFVVCYLLIVRANRGDTSRRLALFCLIASLALGALAAMACFVLLWLDVIYPVAALWFLLVLVLLRRRLGDELRWVRPPSRKGKMATAD